MLMQWTTQNSHAGLLLLLANNEKLFPVTVVLQK
jgi:hypothetical protein